MLTPFSSSGTPLQPLASVLRVEAGGVVVASSALSHEPLLSCLADAAGGSAADDLPPRADVNDGALAPPAQHGRIRGLASAADVTATLTAAQLCWWR